MSEKEDNIIDLYLNLTKKYQTEYGQQTVVLLQVGSFFEIYGLLDKDTKEIGEQTAIKEVAQLCNLNIAEKKNLYKEKSAAVVMCGYRDYCNEKYIQKITEGEYTAIVYVQEKIGREVTRKLDSIHSPGTYVSYETDTNPQITNNIMSIWFDLVKPPSTSATYQQRLIYGVSVINIFTGESFLFEYDCPFSMNPTTFDELERCISVFMPSEVIFISPFPQKEVQKVVQYSGIKTQMIHFVDSMDQSREKVHRCLQQKYTTHILTTFFGEDAHQIHPEFSEYTIATQSFCYLLNFVQEHDPNLVRKVNIPRFNNSSDRMVLANHTLAQLNIINDQTGRQNGVLSSVLSFLNKCMTSMGRRMFQYQLTNPTFRVDWLQQEYDMVSYMKSIPNFSDMVGELRKQLCGIKDIEKNCRQIVLKKIYPGSLYHLYRSIDIIHGVHYTLLKNQIRTADDSSSKLPVTDLHDAPRRGADINLHRYSLIKHPKICEYLCNNVFDPATICPQILAFLDENLDIEKCRGMSSIQTFAENIIQPGISKELDDCIRQIEVDKTAFYNIRDYLTTLLKRELKMKEGEEYIKIHETEKSGKSLQITAKRAVSLRQVLADEKKLQPTVKISGGEHTFEFVLDDVKFVKASTSTEEIHSQLIKDLNNRIIRNEEKMCLLISKVYIEIIEKLENNFFHQIENLSRYVAKLDVLQSKTYIADRYNYCCPVLDNTDGPSFISFREIRHVLIEQINQSEIYVTNDLDIGGGEPNQKRGMLLFGTNAVGKTSLIRAIGISIIMAQSGMFVPCSEFRYKPYQAIFSRILSNDNLFKGLSTFAVEMSELRVILKQSDQYSLILGDELASGTETESALSIFAASLIELDRKRATYMFATHFHEITEFEEIKAMSSLGLKHLAVRYDREHDCLVYDRKLKDGQGDRIYGLEVCMSLALPKEIMDMAFEFRNKYFVNKKGAGELSQKPSQYNANKIRSICEICNTEPATETHHLIPQVDADDKGFIGSFHKNTKANLASICEKCHQRLHHGSGSNESSPIKKETVKMVRKKTTKGAILHKL